MIRTQRVETIRDPDFNVRIGRTIPAHYHFYTLPPEIVSIVPQYRGYDYVVADNEIIISEPKTHRIVYTIPEEGQSGERSNCN